MPLSCVKGSCPGVTTGAHAISLYLAHGKQNPHSTCEEKVEREHAAALPVSLTSRRLRTVRSPSARAAYPASAGAATDADAPSPLLPELLLSELRLTAVSMRSDSTEPREPQRTSSKSTRTARSLPSMILCSHQHPANAHAAHHIISTRMRL